MDNFGFLKVAAAVPHVRVADCDYNTERMAAMAEEAARRSQFPLEFVRWCQTQR